MTESESLQYTKKISNYRKNIGKSKLEFMV